jgi:hypothetical protein
MGLELGLGESLIIKAIAQSTGRTPASIKTDLRKVGDLGLVAEVIYFPADRDLRESPRFALADHTSSTAIARETEDPLCGEKVDCAIRVQVPERYRGSFRQRCQSFWT